MLCEVAAGLHITKGAAGRELGAAWMLHDRFPRTTTALAEGSISLRHATTIAESAAAIPATDSAALSGYERQVVPFAAAETVARTAAFAQSVSASLVPDGMAERHRRARSGRRVTVTDLDDGLAHLSAILPTVLAYAVHDRLTAMGHRLRDDAKAELRARHSDAASDPRCRDAEAPRSPSHRGGRSAQGDPGSAIGCDDADERTLDEVAPTSSLICCSPRLRRPPATRRWKRSTRPYRSRSRRRPSRREIRGWQSTTVTARSSPRRRDCWRGWRRRGPACSSTHTG